MKVLHACAELAPLLKTGGLADVTAALPKAEQAEGVDVRIIIPGFPAIYAGIPTTNFVAQVDTFAGRVALRYGQYQGIGIYIIDAPYLYDRHGSPYHDCYMNDYIDNYRRFALLGWMACELACGIDPFWRAEIVHAHDWHAGMACAYLASKGYPARAVFTIHNLAFHGMFQANHLHELWLPDHFYQIYGLEFYGQISYLKAGLYYADQITTVSPHYAEEITRDHNGYGFEGLLRERRDHMKFSGILNGVDPQIWDPDTDNLITANYSTDNLAHKTANKIALQAEVGLTVDKDALLFAVVSRLTYQKGLDLLADTLPTLISQGGQLVLLGCGDRWLEERFLYMASQYPQQIAVRIGYDEALSHRIMAGSDVIVIPSRFEPCGLTQLYGLKYGTLPLVRFTGGLADTVADCSLENLENGSANGFVFYECDNRQLSFAISRAFTMWRNPGLWKKVQYYAMQQDFSWQTIAKAYIALYKRTVG